MNNCNEFQVHINNRRILFQIIRGSVGTIMVKSPIQWGQTIQKELAAYFIVARTSVSRFKRKKKKTFKLTNE